MDCLGDGGQLMARWNITSSRRGRASVRMGRFSCLGDMENAA